MMISTVRLFVSKLYLFSIISGIFLGGALTLKKVVVPAVYKEWAVNAPEWSTSAKIQDQHNFTVFMYQKLDPSKSNYVVNRGSEGGVYLRYIVDHYDDLPDIMVFVHAHPHEHQKNWLDLVTCVAPTANYININFVNLCRNTHYWKHVEVWVEQCFRDVLKITWDMDHKTEQNESAFHSLVPPTRPIAICLSCCNQFIVSKETIQRRPLKVWKELLRVLGEQEACHLGEPDYENLFVYRNQPSESNKPGPEPPDLPQYKERKGEGFGRYTQGVTTEHLAHVIFGHYGLDMEYPDQKRICENFLHVSQCPGSPCTTLFNTNG